MEYQDDRTDKERETHQDIVLMTDTFMSGWGRADGGTSYAGWACRPEHVNQVKRWVCGRGESRNVEVVDGDFRPQGIGHTHIYVVNDGHPSIQ